MKGFLPMLHKRFIWRQIQHATGQSVVFLICVALAVTTVAGVKSISKSVRQVMEGDAKGLHGGDVVVKSPFPLSADLTAALSELEHQGQIRVSQGWRFYTVARAVQDAQTALVQLQVTDDRYPLYGSVELASGKPLRQVLRKGAVVVEPQVLEQLGITLGESLQVGRATLIVADTIQRESTRPISFFGLGPRILINRQDLEALDLIKPGSRVRHLRYVKLLSAETDLAKMTALIRHAAQSDQASVDDYRHAGSRMGRFFDRFFYFLALVATFNLCVAGIGIYSAATAYLRQRAHSLAIVKSLGASPGFLYGHFLLLLLMLGLLGAGLGITAGYVLQKTVLTRLSAVVGQAILPGLYADIALETLILAAVLVVVFAGVPLLKLGGIMPLQILTKKQIPLKNMPSVRWAIPAALGGLMGLLIWQLGPSPRTFQFLGTLLVYLILLYGLCRFLLWLVKKVPFKGLVYRHARNGLFRPNNATLPTLLSLTAAAVFLLTLYLVERNLEAQLINAYPRSSPNLFFIDIQPDQQAAFQALMERPTTLYPVIRSRLTAINGRPIDRSKERRRQGDNLARPFNLTYRLDLLEDERLIKGKALLASPPGTVAVSVLDTVAEIGNLQLGDRVSFNIQGVPLEAVVSSIRTRTQSSLRPFFYFVFKPEVLLAAPHTLFAAIRVPDAQISALRLKVVTRFPNITVIDATRTLLTFGQVGLKLAVMIRLLGLVSCLVGLLIMVSALVATRQERLRQSVYYRIVGASKGFVQRVFLMESAFIGGIAAAGAIVLAQTSTWLICRRALNINYGAFWAQSLLVGLLILITVVAVGWLASRAVLQYNPLQYLREHAES